MIPLSVATQVRATLIDYLRTTTSFQDEALDAALAAFLEAELFRGPYVDLRLPFRKAGPEDALPLAGSSTLPGSRQSTLAEPMPVMNFFSA